MFVCIGVAAYFYFMKDPRDSEQCAYGCDQTAIRSPWLNGPDCLSVKETTLDSSIPMPTQIPYLSNFRFSPGAGYAFCSPAWYAFRYVRNSDGAYGPLSEWSGTDLAGGTPNGTPLAIYACATKLPCVPSSSPVGSSVRASSDARSCAAAGIPTGSGTTTFNAPTIALTKPLDIDTKFETPGGYTMNVHRQVGYIDGNGNVVDFDPKSEGKIVGFFIENPIDSSGKPRKGLYATLYDVAFPPDSNQETSCGC